MNIRNLPTIQLQAVIRDVQEACCPCDALKDFAQACQAELQRRQQSRWGCRQATLDGAAIQGRKGGQTGSSEGVNRFTGRPAVGPVDWMEEECSRA